MARTDIFGTPIENDDYMSQPVAIPTDVLAQDKVRTGFESGIPQPRRATGADVPANQTLPDGTTMTGDPWRDNARNRHDQSKLIRVARSIAKTDPSTWDKRLERFNRGAAGAVESLGQTGTRLTRDEIMKAARRPIEAVPHGIYGTYPDVVGEKPDRRMGGGNTFELEDGMYEPRLVGGKKTGVPVVELPGIGNVPDADLDGATFDRVYTRNDAARTSRAIYGAGYDEFSMRQRRIDAGRAALLDDTLTRPQRDQGELQLQRMENDLHREFIRSVAGRMTQGEKQTADMTDPREYRERRKIAQEYADSGMPEDEAYKMADRAMTGDQVPLPKKSEKEKETRGFNYEGFSRTVESKREKILSQLLDSASSLPGGSANLKPDSDAYQRAYKKAERDAYAQAIAENNEFNRADQDAYKERLSSGMSALAQRYANMEIRAGDAHFGGALDPRPAVRRLVVDNLPAYTERIRAGGPGEIDRIVEEIIARDLPHIAAEGGR